MKKFRRISFIWSRCFAEPAARMRPNALLAFIRDGKGEEKGKWKKIRAEGSSGGRLAHAW